ncbi:hypothetical protein TA3x_005310 [Tundrisphaera sp. TA3]|uniref:hypothetical protein n=1 Tax=Tundrisphaera sp. TA3 TaxID=3435775 RepID=UPI003EBE86FD
MRLPRVRRMMVAVAATALLLGAVAERRARFLRLAESHAAWAGKMVIHEAEGRYKPITFDDPNGQPVKRARRGWHFDLAAKYRRAARLPFLPVPPDPPVPPERTR